MKSERESGILLHITSLPSPGGIGTLGQAAYDFADFLKASGITLWQVLPIGPTGYGDSPYQSSSTHAGNPLLIDGEMLEKEGIVSGVQPPRPPKDPCRADFQQVKAEKAQLLQRAFDQSYHKLEPEVNAFRAAQGWVEDYALFEAAREHFEFAPLDAWPDKALRMRQPQALADWREKLASRIDYFAFVQYLFDRQWEKLRFYCNMNGIKLLGDVPIYVAGDSADTWVDPQVFRLDADRRPVKVAGVPPDYFSQDGQLWGNPCYDWKAMKKESYAWWVKRMATMARRFDMVRLDHFIGFAHYYAVDYGAPNARVGKWKKGPGKALFRVLERELPQLRIVAEDLGVQSPQVHRLLKWSEFPGMKVLQFSFGSGPKDPGLPANVKKNCAYYTGTHDNDTTLGWWKSAGDQERKLAAKVLGVKKDSQVVQAMVKAVLASRARIAVIPMQDYLGLDTWARMNLPGSVGGDNWRWRMAPGAADEALARRIAKLNQQAEGGTIQ